MHEKLTHLCVKDVQASEDHRANRDENFSKICVFNSKLHAIYAVEHLRKNNHIGSDRDSGNDNQQKPLMYWHGGERWEDTDVFDNSSRPLDNGFRTWRADKELGEEEEGETRGDMKLTMLNVFYNVIYTFPNVINSFAHTRNQFIYWLHLDAEISSNLTALL